MNIKISDITMKFNDVTAVDKLSLTIEEGHLVALLGPSGCGKSTTLFMLAGLYKPTTGDLLFGDKIVNKVEPEDRGIGMVFQNYALYPHMTVLRNIMFPLRMAKVTKKEAEERALEMAKLVKIDHLVDRKPGQLSGGQQQRVAIARALVKKPKLLLLDEPLSNLDARLRLEMREEIRRIQQEVGITTIFVTHDQEEAMSISDKVLLMKDGKFQQYSPPQSMYNQPVNAFVASFMGSPPINMIPATLDQSTNQIKIDGTQDVLENQSERALKPASSGKILLGIRPEDLVIAQNDKTTDFITVKVSIVERIGRDTLLNASINELNIRALVDSDCEVKEGDLIKLSIRNNRVHLFDPVTEENLLIEAK